MVGWIDISDCSSSDPGQSGSLSPYCDMESLYFDNSLYENEMHYKISKYLDDNPLDDEYEEVVIDANDEDEYNSKLDDLYKAAKDKLKMTCTKKDPIEIVEEKDPRENYRKFDESFLVSEEDKKN